MARQGTSGGAWALLPTKRRLIQLYAALLYNANLKGFVQGRIYTGTSKAVCVPGLNCYSCPGAVGACPLGALQNALAASTTRAPSYVLGILLLQGLLLGRTVCGWLCPFGMIQELLHKVPGPKIRKGHLTRALSYLKYVTLAVFVMAIPLWNALRHVPLPAFCKYLCPAGTLEGAVALLVHPANADKLPMLGGLFVCKAVILALVIGGAIVAFRPFCRFVCPLGALYGLFSRVALLGVRVDEGACIHCDRCVRACRMDVARVGDHECIHCGDCAAVCPVGAIAFKGLRGMARPAQGQSRTGALGRPLALGMCALLVGALAWYNVLDDSGAITAPQPDASLRAQADVSGKGGQGTGPEVGMQAPDFTVPLYVSAQVPEAGRELALSDCRGKTVVINFWATWCTPCIGELPAFDRVQAEHPDDVVVIAIHADMVVEDVQGWIDRERYQHLAFGQDEDGTVLEAFGGSTMLPQTIVVDPDGTVVYNGVASMTYDTLSPLVEQDG